MFDSKVYGGKKESWVDSFFNEMEWKKNRSTLFEEIEPVIKGMGFSLVELSRQHIKGRLQVRLVVYHYSGVGLKDCEIIYKTIMPRLELIEQSQDIFLEVTSPGINRNIKYAHEFLVFIDRMVSVYCEDDDKWVSGKILLADDNNLELQTNDGIIHIPIQDIKKAKLTYSQEDNK